MLDLRPALQESVVVRQDGWDPADLEVRVTRRRRRRAMTIAGGAVLTGLVGVMLIVRSDLSRQLDTVGTTSSTPPPSSEPLGRSVERLVVTGGPGAEEVAIVFDGPLPEGDAVYVADIRSAENPSGLAYTTQGVDGVVWECGTRHWGFGPAATTGSIDVLIPSGWVAPDGVQAREGGVSYVDDPDHVGKIIGCGPYKGYVQYSIWGSASDDPNDVRVVADGDSIRVVVQTPEG